MHKDISPEEKLLSLIKRKHGKADHAPEKKAIHKEKKAQDGYKEHDRVDEYLSSVIKSNFFKSNLFDPRAIREFNRYLAIIIAILICYVIFDCILVHPSKKAGDLISKTAILKPAAQVAKREMPVETKNYSYYAGRIGTRAIFKGGANTETPLTQAGESTAVDLGLVGIVPGSNPQAIIEDKKNQKTYYLIKGQTVNGITVEEINADKVMLDYNGKKMSLIL